jgi:hypothetical protein
VNLMCEVELSWTDIETCKIPVTRIYSLPNYGASVLAACYRRVHRLLYSVCFRKTICNFDAELHGHTYIFFEEKDETGQYDIRLIVI